MLHLNDWEYFIHTILGGKDWLWASFILFGVFTFFSAKYMVTYITAVGLRFKINAGIIAGLFVSIITSIPELVAGIFSGIEGNKGPSGDKSAALIGINNEIGANLFTIIIVAIGNIIFFRSILKKGITKSTIIASVFGLVSVLIFIVSLIAHPLKIPFISVSLATLLAFLFYLVYTIYTLFFDKTPHDDEEVSTEQYKNKINKWVLILLVSIFAAFLSFFAYVQAELADLMGSASNVGGYGLGNTLAGGLLLTFATAMPEAVSFFYLSRKGFHNAAILGMLGSQIFNLSIAFFTDLINRKEALINLIFDNGNDRWQLLVLFSGFLLIAIITLFCFWLQNALLRTILHDDHKALHEKIKSHDGKKKVSWMIQAMDHRNITPNTKTMFLKPKKKHWFNTFYFKSEKTIKIALVFSRFIFPGILVIMYLSSFILAVQLFPQS